MQTVQTHMTKKVLRLTTGMTLGDAAALFLKHHISGAPVVNRRSQLIGVLSEKDIFSALYPNVTDMVHEFSAWLDGFKREYRLGAKRELIIDSIMTRKPITITPTTTLLEAGSKMIAFQIHRLIVVNRQKKIVGIVTRREIFHHLLKQELAIR